MDILSSTKSRFLSTLGLTAATALASLMAVPAANAATLTSVSDFSERDTWDKLFEVEGRAGGRGDYEYAIGPEGANSENTGTIELDWINGEEVAWDLIWDGTTATFSIGGRSISYNSPTLVGPNEFDGLYFLAQAKGAGSKISPGTEMFLAIEEINGMVQTDLDARGVAPESGGNLQRFLFTSDMDITSLSGIARLSWDPDGVNPVAKRAAGRATFKIKGYDATDTMDVPEPGMLLGLLAFGGIGYLQKKRAAL
ncbi:MAG: choice-of-anchor W domain-containing protein [Cyanobacteria bacterium P01_H01_bin.130]